MVLRFKDKGFKLFESDIKKLKLELNWAKNAGGRTICYEKTNPINMVEIKDNKAEKTILIIYGESAVIINTLCKNKKAIAIEYFINNYLPED